MARGDHLKSPRRGYSHHGIDLGDGRVAHYSGLASGFSSGPVEVVCRADFAQGRPVGVVRHPHRRFSPDETVRRALRRVGESAYRVDNNNCEHFVNWCLYGRHTSRQVDIGSSAVSGANAVGAGAGATAMVSSAGAVAGLSGPGVMSGLAAIGPGGAIGGVVTLAGGAGFGTAALLNNTVLADNEALEDGERGARRAGRRATYAAAGATAAGGVAAISAAGTAGVSAAGITSGLAAIGGVVGGGMVAGTAVLVAAPVVTAAGAGLGVYKLAQWLKS